ncbi:MAG: glycosyltransferase family 2 protein [Bryobacteraceae bacterium]|jgi:cellulose synthase/poly-beta-1,6-N-acetylglucosamine synthase-like glycosyltransferase
MNPAADWAATVLTAAALVLTLAGVAAFGVLLKGCLVLRRLRRRNPDESGNVLLKSPLVPAVSVLAVCRDASPDARAFVRRLLCLDFGRSETVLVLENPGEAGREAWSSEFRLRRSSRVGGTLASAKVRAVYQSLDPVRMVVVETEVGRRSESWNAAANAAQSPLLAVFDPASEFPQDALLTLIRPMLEDPAGTVAVCGGAPGPLGESWAARFWGLEEIRIWLGRAAAAAGWDRLGPFPGSALLVRKDAIEEAGGFRDGSLDTVLAVRKRRPAAGKPAHVALVPDPVAYCRSPRSVAELHRTIGRDQHALARAVRMEGLGGMGWVLPGLVGWRLLLPVIETGAYLVLAAAVFTGHASGTSIGLVFMATLGTGALVSMAAVVLRELAQYEASDPSELVKLFAAAMLEGLGYRQLRNLWLIADFFGKGDITAGA